MKKNNNCIRRINYLRMCYKRREFSNLNDPKFLREIPNPILVEMIIQILEDYLADLQNEHDSTQLFEQDLDDLEDMFDTTTITDAIRSLGLYSMAFIKMILKYLLERFIAGTFWLTFFHLVFLLLLPEISSMLFINPAKVISSDIGCPGDTKCINTCQEGLLFNTKGFCVGPDTMLCRCGPFNITYPSDDAKATTCNHKECGWKCAEYRMPLIGKCEKGMCKCGYNVTFAGSYNITFQPTIFCLDHCCVPITLSFFLECHDGKVLVRKGMFNCLKQMADFIGSTSTVEDDGCIEKNATEKFTDTVGNTWTKISIINLKLQKSSITSVLS